MKLIEPGMPKTDAESTEKRKLDDLATLCQCENMAILLGYTKSKALSLYRQYVQELTVRNDSLSARDKAQYTSFESWLAATYTPSQATNGYEDVRGVFFDDTDMVLRHPDLFGLHTCRDKYGQLYKKWPALIEETARVLNKDSDILRNHLPPIGLCELFPDDEQDEYRFKLYYLIHAKC